ncbi:MAG: rhomboid family intramembrane serine protease [Bdellovibrionaceae bacterium]|nr:rhomboid family intramembrane serine protease [Pseudobdellovibrionaceae bacterium]
MILPQPAPLSKYHRYPLTWTLLLLNTLIYFVFFSGRSDDFYQQRILSSTSAVVTGKLYFQYLQSLTNREQESRAFWTAKMNPENAEQMEILGSYALRDKEFLTASQSAKFQGDEVAIERWRKDIFNFSKSYEKDSIFSFGLAKMELRSSTWITYQFSHASVTHLFSNMLFLVVIGSVVETLVGGFGLLFLYLLGGISGGIAFLFYNGHGVIPMVGASASISALLAFYFVVETRRRIRFFYFISPFPGHNGFIYLPTLLIFPLFILVDFTSLMANPEGLGGGVAYSAHIGGTLFGFLAGAVARWVLHVERPLTYDDPTPPPEQNHDEEYFL